MVQRADKSGGDAGALGALAASCLEDCAPKMSAHAKSPTSGKTDTFRESRMTSTMRKPLVIPAAAQADGLAIGADDFADPDCGRTALGTCAHERDRVANLDRALGPASAGQVVGASQFALPLLDGAVVALNIDSYKHMWIDKLEVRDDAFYRDCLGHVIGGRAMMGECSAGNCQNGYGQQCENTSFHTTPP